LTKPRQTSPPSRLDVLALDGEGLGRFGGVHDRIVELHAAPRSRPPGNLTGYQVTGVKLQLNDAADQDSRRQQQAGARRAEVLDDAVYSLFTRVNCSGKIHFNAWIQPTVVVTVWHSYILHVGD
jgi:hypothetical protein